MSPPHSTPENDSYDVSYAVNNQNRYENDPYEDEPHTIDHVTDAENTQEISELYRRLYDYPLPSCMSWENHGYPILKIKRLDRVMLKFGMVWTSLILFFMWLVSFMPPDDPSANPAAIFLMFLSIFLFVGICLLASGLYPFLFPIKLHFRPENGRIQAISGMDQKKIQFLNIPKTQLIRNSYRTNSSYGTRANATHFNTFSLEDNITSVTLIQNVAAHDVDQFENTLTDILEINKAIHSRLSTDRLATSNKPSMKSKHVGDPQSTPTPKSTKSSSFKDFYQNSCR